MHLRKHKVEDGLELTKLFYETVHDINCKDYALEQINDWSPEYLDLEKWKRSFENHIAIVAVEEDKIVGFGDIELKKIFEPPIRT